MANTTRGLILKKEKLLGRFRGAMVGAVVGDCLGAHFEMRWNIQVKQVVDFFSSLPSFISKASDSDQEDTFDSKPSKLVTSDNETDSDTKHSPKKTRCPHLFTDDTAMARSVAVSLMTHNQVDARDMAERFAGEYAREPWRGYGGSVARVFRQLKDEGFKDPHGPARRQFDGAGSYGNGGAMRIVPASLFSYSLPEEGLNSVVDAITRVTHTHRDALNGAKLQCAAVRASLQQAGDSILDTDLILDQLDAIAFNLETKSLSTTQESPPLKRKRKSDGADQPYCTKLKLIREYLKSDTEISRSDIEEWLGNDVSALGSVPAAIYCFLRAGRPIPDIPFETPFERAIIYAVTLGGDTDTIATMAGAMAGAYYGIDAIPKLWRETCEGVEEAENAAVELHRMAVLNRPSNIEGVEDKQAEIEIKKEEPSTAIDTKQMPEQNT